MDRTIEAKSWRRGFAGGFAALLLAIAGQATVSAFSAPESCPAEPPVAQRLIEKLTPRESGLTQRVAIALLGAVLLHTCS